MNYDEYYKNNKNVFGKEPEKVLVKYSSLISKKNPVLDIGSGQGRNTIYLSNSGYLVDAIDTSSASIQMLENIKKAENLSFNTYQADFKDYIGSKNYSSVLLFGLIQILDWNEIDLLKRKISTWLEEKGLLFVTTFLVSDNSYNKIKKESEIIGRNSYLRPTGEKRTFFEPEEIKRLFKEYKSLHYWEGSGPDHRHGDSPVERHALVEAVFQK